MTIRGAACIVGAFEHPTRHAPDKSTVQLHAEAALGALADAGLTRRDVDAYFCASDAPGLGAFSMIDYLNLSVRHVDTTEAGGASYPIHVAHAARAIAAGRCDVALITMAGRPRAEQRAVGAGPRTTAPGAPERPWEALAQPGLAEFYAMVARRHSHEYGTTAEQLAWIKVAASRHAQYNPQALRPEPVTVEEVLASPIVADPLHRLDCCIISDGGGALVVARPEIARDLGRPRVTLRGAGEAPCGQAGGRVDLRWSGAARSGPIAFAEAGVSPRDIKYASIYDSFTITVLQQIEDLGFCDKGQGGRFVADGNLISGIGRLPFNTDGGGLCNNHPAHRGGMIRTIEAVRQLRGAAHPAVQVPNCDLAIVQATGGILGSRHASATLILERE